MTMRRARAAYAADHMHTVEALRVRKSDSPSFRQWARERFKRASAGELSPKLAKIVGKR